MAGPRNIASGGTDLCTIKLGPGGVMEPTSAVGFIGASAHAISIRSEQASQLKEGALNTTASAQYSVEGGFAKPSQTPNMIGGLGNILS